jgi:hypothetical protein
MAQLKFLVLSSLFHYGGEWMHVRNTYGQMDKRVVHVASSVAATNKKSYEGETHMN